MLANYEVAWIFVDFESSFNMLFKETMDQMDLGKYKMELMVTALLVLCGMLLISWK